MLEHEEEPAERRLTINLFLITTSQVSGLEKPRIHSFSLQA